MNATLKIVDSEAQKALADEEGCEKDIDPTTCSLELLQLVTLLNQSFAMSWLVKGLIPLEGLVWLYGLWGCYKSFVAVDFAICVASGMSWLDRKVTAGAVVYLAGEGVLGIRTRFAAALQERGLPRDLPIYVSRCGHPLDSLEGSGAAIKAIEALGISIALIIVDTQNTWQSGDENSTQDATTFLSALKMLVNRFNCVVMVVHHMDKGGKTLRGSGVYQGGADAIIRVEKKKADGENRAKLTVDKCKDGESDQTHTLQLPVVVLNGQVDEDGEPIKTLVVKGAARAEADGHARRLAQLLLLVKDHPETAKTELVKLAASNLKVGEKSVGGLLEELVGYQVLNVETHPRGKKTFSATTIGLTLLGGQGQLPAGTQGGAMKQHSRVFSDLRRHCEALTSSASKTSLCAEVSNDA